MLGGQVFKILLFGISLLVLAAGCSSKKAKDDHQGKLDESAISAEAMNFDPQGSDSQKIDGLKSIHFQFNKSSLDSEERNILVKNAEWLKTHNSVVVQIEGHCDLKGSIEYNLALGERRAKAAQDYLLSLGVRPNQLSIISYGKEKPLTTDESDEAQAKNRRDNFMPTKK
jgi:peptidoglycan-associated lipoprotein